MKKCQIIANETVPSQRFHTKTKSDARILNGFQPNRNMQGPESCVSTVFSSCVDMMVESISSLLSDFPDIASDISPEMLSTKPNESFFSSSREKVVTPDPLEMAFIYPKIVTQHVKRCSENQYFIYYTGNDNLYEKMRMNTFVDISIPRIQREKGVNITDNDMKLLRDYKARYLQGVRQNSVRNQNTKHRPGTLSYYAYNSAPPEPTPIDLSSLLSHDNTSIPEESTNESDKLYSPTSTLLIVSDLSEVVLAKPLADVHDGEDFSADIYINNHDHPLELTKYGTISIRTEDIIREVNITCLQELSDSEYSNLIQVSCEDHLTQSEHDELEADVLQAINSDEPGQSTSTRCQRRRNVPARMRDDNFFYLYI